MEVHSTRQCKPDNCPFKDYKGVRRDKAIFICDVPLEERHKYLDSEQDINDPRMRIVGHVKNKLENPMEEQAKQIAVLSNHMIELTNQLNELTKKLKNMNP